MLNKLKTGDQPRHNGMTLNKVENPDKVIEIYIDTFCACDLVEVLGTIKTRQMFDIPKIIVTVT